MMKQKLFILTLLCFGLLTTAFADNGDKKKKTTKPGTPAKAVVKSNNKLKTTTLKDNVMAPGKFGNTNETTVSSVPDLFETVSGTNSVKLNARAVSFVEDYMEENSKELLKMKDWGRPYFNMMDAVFTKYSLPIELKYLAVIESKLKSTALSRVGARGPWQLMPVTARELGLKVNAKVDERINYYKSTTAAALYLRDLYAEFGDWLLVIAAYNGGPGVVYNAVKKSGGSRNFWAIQSFLPSETRNHVKKFIGTHYIFEGQGGITTLTKAETADQISAISQILSNRNLTVAEMAEVKSIQVSGKYHSAVIAKMVVMEIDEFSRYNPNFDRVMAKAENTYELKLPQDKMELFIANKYQILNESVQMLLSGATSVSKPAGKK